MTRLLTMVSTDSTRLSTSSALSSPRFYGQRDVTEEVTIFEFNASQQTILFRELKGREVSGQLMVRDHRGIESILHFYFGRLIYATGGIHPMRRWQNHLTLFCPELTQERLNNILSFVMPKMSHVGWQYDILGELGKHKKISLEELTRFIKSIISEVLFDLTQAGEVTYRFRYDKQFSVPLVAIDPEQIVVEVWKQWQSWKSARLGDRFPNSAPTIKNDEELVKKVSPITYRFFRERLDGQTTLRELSVQLRQDIVKITRSLMLYVQLGLIDLVAVADLKDPLETPRISAGQVLASKRPLVAYVEEQQTLGVWLQQTMEKLGYELIAIPDGLQAIAYFLQRKPDMIFLASEMMMIDGYTICRELRQIENFQQIPIIIITHHLSIIERMRAKMVGATELVSQTTFIESLHHLVNQNPSANHNCLQEFFCLK